MIICNGRGVVHAFCIILGTNIWNPRFPGGDVYLSCLLPCKSYTGNNICHNMLQFYKYKPNRKSNYVMQICAKSIAG